MFFSRFGVLTANREHVRYEGQVVAARVVGNWDWRGGVGSCQADGPRRLQSE